MEVKLIDSLIFSWMFKNTYWIICAAYLSLSCKFSHSKVHLWIYLVNYGAAHVAGYHKN